MKQLRMMSILVVLAILFIFANVSPAAAEGQSRHTCVVMADGSVKCWGYNYYGQLGNGTYSHSSTPVDVSGLTGVVKVATGRVHTCALTTSGGVKCWGQNFYGQLGAGYRTTDASGGINTPVDVVGLSSGVAQVSTGTGHTCVLTTGGGVKCWGNNYAGQVGIGSSGSAAEYIFIPTDVVGLTSGVAQISASDRFTCALMTSGGVKCWGLNERGQLGNGTLTDSSTPVDAVGLSSGIIQISTTYRQTYALTTDGAVKYWGLIHRAIAY